MANRSNGGKREQERRAAETIKGMSGDAESSIARHRAELERLIDDGRVEPIFGATNMRNQVFEGWLQLQDLPDPQGAFVALCGEWYREMNPPAPTASFIARDRSVAQEAAAWLDGRTTKPSRAEVDAAVERGEVSFDAAILAYCSWELRQRIKLVSAEEEIRDRARVQELMGKLEKLVRPGKVEEVRAIVEQEVMRSTGGAWAS